MGVCFSSPSLTLILSLFTLGLFIGIKAIADAVAVQLSESMQLS